MRPLSVAAMKAWVLELTSARADINEANGTLANAENSFWIRQRAPAAELGMRDRLDAPRMAAHISAFTTPTQFLFASPSDHLFIYHAGVAGKTRSNSISDVNIEVQ